MKVYVIQGNPTPLSRPRFSSQSKKAYNPMRNQMLITGITLQSQHNNDPIFDGPVHMDVVFYMPYPSKLTKKELSVIQGAPHATYVDLDNLIKFVNDVAQGIILKNDSLVASICAKKVYDNNPRTEFSFQSLSGEKNGIKKT